LEIKGVYFMSKNVKLFVASAVVVASLVGVSVPVSAAECKINPVTEGQLTLTSIQDESSNTTLNGNTITTKLVVEGDEDCEKSASIGVWEWSTENGLPLSSQTIYKTTTASFGPGEHTLSIEVPACKWQADVMEGTRATAADGSADYQIGDPSDPNSDRFLDVAYGGDKVCSDEPTPSTPTNPASTITSLPNTGMGGTAVVASALSAVSGFGYAVVRKLKFNR
jgi:hypothetical protein